MNSAMAAKILQDVLPRMRSAAFNLHHLAADTWRATRRTTADTVVEMGASFLEKGIVMLRRQALDDGAQPVPGIIREQLVGYFPDALLERVRYKIGWSDRWPLHSSLFSLVNARAVALVDVIIFRDSFVAADPAIWAHELAHVQQYDRWGTSDFARRYLQEPGEIESHAWEIAASYTMWALQEGRLHEPLQRPAQL